MKIGIKGISYSATERKYLVRIHKDSKRVYLGRFSSLEEAQAALRAHEGETEQQNSNTPILNSLRAQFAPARKSNKKNVAVAKPTPKPDVFVLSSKSRVTTGGKPKVKSKVTKDLSVTGSVSETTVSSVDQELLNRSLADKTFELILMRLLELAYERKTSVFAVIAQEVARLSEK